MAENRGTFATGVCGEILRLIGKRQFPRYLNTYTATFLEFLCHFPHSSCAKLKNTDGSIYQALRCCVLVATHDPFCDADWFAYAFAFDLNFPG